jgi:hypothetical protein
MPAKIPAPFARTPTARHEPPDTDKAVMCEPRDVEWLSPDWLDKQRTISQERADEWSIAARQPVQVRGIASLPSHAF